MAGHHRADHAHYPRFRTVAQQSQNGSNSTATQIGELDTTLQLGGCIPTFTRQQSWAHTAVNEASRKDQSCSDHAQCMLDAVAWCTITDRDHIHSMSRHDQHSSCVAEGGHVSCQHHGNRQQGCELQSGMVMVTCLDPEARHYNKKVSIFKNLSVKRIYLINCNKKLKYCPLVNNFAKKNPSNEHRTLY